MSVIHSEPEVDSTHAPATNPGTAEPSSPGGAPSDAPSPPTVPGTDTSPTDPALPQQPNLLGALPDDEAQVRAAPRHADASSNPFQDAAAPVTEHALDYEPTPELPPRPDAATEADQTPHTMTTTGVETQTPPAGAETGAEQVSPQAAALRSMFPDFDVAVLQSVLDSVNGDQERAIDLLLGMSDPDYVSTQTVPQAADPALDLDEQLARQLMLEDQQQQQRHAQGYSWPRRDQADVPYQARQAPGGNQGRMPPAEGRSDFQELQRTMGQIAESGKRTFSSIVSKVKAKINEYETNKSPGQPSNAPAAPQWGAAPAPQLDRHTASQAYQPNYYYGTEPSPTAEQPISLNGPAAPRAQQQVQGYDLDSAPAIVAPVPVPAAAPTTPPPAAAARLSPAASPRPSSGDVPRPPAPSSGSPVNAAKIGLLPKRPVSLLSAGSPPATRPSDDDELEYVENPFEDRK